MVCRCLQGCVCLEGRSCHGCFFHTCSSCFAGKLDEEHPTLTHSGKTFKEVYEETLENTAYLRRCLGDDSHVVEIWECQWKTLHTDPVLKGVVDALKKVPCWLPRRLKQLGVEPSRSIVTMEDLVEGVKDGSLFCAVECDFHVTDRLRDFFSEMCPISKNAEVGIDDIGDHMAVFARECGLLKKPRRNLMGSLKGEKILIATPLLKWYLEHGLIVTRVFEVIEFTPVACFKPAGEAVSQARRAGDGKDDRLKILAETMKLIGNSSYGKMITNNTKYRQVEYCSWLKTRRAINTPFYRSCEEVSEDLWEVESIT